MRYAYHRGEYLRVDGTHMLETHALHYASSVFEGIRVYAGHAFMLREHAERLITSAHLIGLDAPFDVDHVCRVCQDLVATSGLKDAYLRPLIYDPGPGLDVYAHHNTCTLGVVLWEWPHVFESHQYTRGVSLSTDVPFCRPDPASYPPQAKASSGYMMGTANRRHAVKNGFDDALLRSLQGYIAETTAANIFFVFKDRLATPTPDCFLNGITRQVAMKLAQSLGMGAEDAYLNMDDIKEATEVFLTGTAYEITPVTLIDTHHYPVGPTTRLIQERYRDLCYHLSPHVCM